MGRLSLVKPLRFAKLLGTCLAVSVILSPAVFADSKSFITVQGGDVFAGGWFDDNEDSCSNSDLNYTTAGTTATTKYRGGILTFAKDVRRNTSSLTDEAAFGLGGIEYDQASANIYGFYSGPSAAGLNSLTFAAPAAGDAGSLGAGFEDISTIAPRSLQTHCIPDYFSTKDNGSLYPWGVSETPATMGNVKYYVDVTDPSNCPSPVCVNGVFNITGPGNNDSVIPAGRHATVFVNGDVHIGRSITYAAFNADNVPKFALVVRGNIYVDPSVINLDGVYIAQPNPGDANPLVDDTGNIWTCHDEVRGSDLAAGWLKTMHSCGTLHLDGAFIAKDVKLLRADSDINSGSGPAPAEDFDYTPDMVIGGPFFNPVPGTNSVKVHSIISLPPSY